MDGKASGQGVRPAKSRQARGMGGRVQGLGCRGERDRESLPRVVGE